VGDICAGGQNQFDILYNKRVKDETHSFGFATGTGRVCGLSSFSVELNQFHHCDGNHKPHGLIIFPKGCWGQVLFNGFPLYKPDRNR
jgi:hypothetical protein